MAVGCGWGEGEVVGVDRRTRGWDGSVNVAGGCRGATGYLKVPPVRGSCEVAVGVDGAKVAVYPIGLGAATPGILS